MKFKMTPVVSQILNNDGQVVNQANTESLARMFYMDGNRNMGLLPPAVRWVSDDGQCMVVERPPEKHIVSVRCGATEEGYNIDKQFEIPVPWTVWGLRFWNHHLQGMQLVHMAVRPGPISSMQDELYLPPYPNIYTDDGKVCHMPELESIQFRSVADAINQCVGGFWNGGVNEDLSGHIHMKIRRLGGLEGYYQYLEGRSLEQTLEDIGPTINSTPTVKALTERLRSRYVTSQSNTTVMYMRNLIRKTAGTP